LIVISPFAKENFVSHSLADQTSITRFAEDNWGLRQIGNGSFDAIAGSLLDVFDFVHAGGPDRDRTLILDPDSGDPVQGYR
jgi:phospholipase C